MKSSIWVNRDVIEVHLCGIVRIKAVPNGNEAIVRAQQQCAAPELLVGVGGTATSLIGQRPAFV